MILALAAECAPAHVRRYSALETTEKLMPPPVSFPLVRKELQRKLSLPARCRRLSSSKKTAAHCIKTKRVYLDAEKSDGYRVLVDRLWPRGVSKEKAALDEWNKVIAPSDEARKSFAHVIEKYDSFKAQYAAELDANQDAKLFAEKVAAELEERNVTLLFAAKDTEHNNAVVLEQWLRRK